MRSYSGAGGCDDRQISSLAGAFHGSAKRHLMRVEQFATPLALRFDRCAQLRYQMQ